MRSCCSHPFPVSNCCRAAGNAALEVVYQHSGHNRHTPDTRRAIVIACAKVYTGGELDCAAALHEYVKLPQSLQRDELGSNYAEVMRGRWRHFLAEGDLKDDHRSGAPHVISVEDALLASAALKAGREITKWKHGTPFILVTYFVTVRAAIALVPELKRIQMKYGATPHELYLAMKRADPNLIRRSIFLKPAFTDAQIVERFTWCANLTAQWQLPLAALKAILCRIVQCDEGRFTYTVKAHGSRRVFMDKRTNLAHDYVTLPLINGQEEATVHFFICVSAHPAFAYCNGLVYEEFTTGTTNIRRLYNTRGQTTDEAFEYTVSYNSFTLAGCQMHHC